MWRHLKNPITTLHDLIAQAMQKKEEEEDKLQKSKRAKERYLEDVPIIPSYHVNDSSIYTASPTNSAPDSSKVMVMFIPEVGRIEDDIPLIKEGENDTLRSGYHQNTENQAKMTKLSMDGKDCAKFKAKCFHHIFSIIQFLIKPGFDRLGEEAAKRLHDEEQVQVDIQRAEMNKRRQQEVLASAMYYTEADWINIMAQVEANASLSKTLLGDDVTEDNFPVRMAALIKRKKQALAEKLAKERMERPMTPVQQRTYMRQFVKNQSSALYSTGWTKAKVESFTDAQLKEEFEKIQKALANTQVQAFSRTLKRTGPELEEPSSKQQKSTEAPIPSVPDVPQPPVVSSPKSSGTRRKSLGRNRLTKPKSILKELDLDADDKTFIKVVSDEDSTDEAPILWSALAGWEVISTPLGEINALYRSDQSTKHFTTLREILHMVDRQDLLKLYGMVVTYYENHLVAGAGLMLWGDLQVLMDSQEGGKGSFVWNHQSLWQIRSWRLYTLSNVHVLETVSGEVLYMFADVSYPLSVKLMERMLKHKLEIDKDVVGNDMTTAEQLIRFIKNQIAAAQVSPV
ncbi:hypothetical protein Tco_1070217 [Tanacetum coccineum]|uniref:Aminoacyl-tRNA synthetase, class 1a, anticodon-binding n=1 Tax=Tanacetum coccineum TaxID=301880 RepID=A0ABQ5HMN4_9ASTR